MQKKKIKLNLKFKVWISIHMSRNQLTTQKGLGVKHIN